MNRRDRRRLRVSWRKGRKDAHARLIDRARRVLSGWSVALLQGRVSYAEKQWNNDVARQRKLAAQKTTIGAQGVQEVSDGR